MMQDKMLVFFYIQSLIGWRNEIYKILSYQRKTYLLKPWKMLSHQILRYGMFTDGGE